MPLGAQTFAFAPAVRRLVPADSERMPESVLVSAAAVWLKDREASVSPRTMAAYRGAIGDFLSHLKSAAFGPLRLVSTLQIRSWHLHCAARTSAATANNKLKIIRIFLRQAWLDGQISCNPAERLQPLAQSRPVRPGPTAAELAALWQAAGPEWRGLILVRLATAARLREIALLRRGDFDAVGGRLSFTRSRRHFILPAVVIRLLQPLVAAAPGTPAAEGLFPEAYELAVQRGDSSALSQRYYALLIAAGLAEARPESHGSRGVGRNAPRARHRLSFESLPGDPVHCPEFFQGLAGP